jgi:uncharacterized membrane protein HdeD (DUF308 family)
MSTNSDSTTGFLGAEFLDQDWKARAQSLERGWVLTAAIVAILFGIFVLVRPSAGLVTVAIIFGTYLVIAGVSRVSFAIANHGRSTGYRWFSGILGALIVVAGFICLVNLVTSLQTLGIVVGVALIVSGIAELLPVDKDPARPTWLRVTTGIVSILAGLVMFAVPFFSVGLIVVIGAISLIVIGIAGLIALPRVIPSTV